MRMTYASFRQYLWKCWHDHDTRHLSPWRNEKGATAMKQKWCHGNISENDATATYPKMMPRQHIGSGSSRRYRCKRRRADACHARMVGWSRITGFPRVDGMANEEEYAMTTPTRCKYGHHIQHMPTSTDGRLGVIPLKRAFSGWNESVRSRGSRRSRDGRSGSSGTQRR